MKTELYQEVLVKSSLVPDTYADDNTFNGTTVDMYAGGQRFDAAMAVVVHGTISSTYSGTVTLEESDDGSSWSTVTGDLQGSFLAVATAQSEKVKAVGYKGSARYLRLVLTAAEASAQTAFVTGLILVAPGTRAPITQP